MDDGEDDERFMRLALAEAEQAYREGEVPVGAVVVRDGVVIGSGHNRRENDRDPTAHAEMLALRRAANVVGHWRLDNCTLYATLEPCAMCAGAIVQSRLPRLVFGATDAKAGAVVSLFNLTADLRLNHRLPHVGGVLGVEGGAILTRFFAAQRALGKK